MIIIINSTLVLLLNNIYNRLEVATLHVDGECDAHPVIIWNCFEGISENWLNLYNA